MKIRLTPADQVRTALIGPRTRPLRTVLSALGIAVGIAALTAITGIAASNQAQLLAQFDALGANMLVVAPGTGPDNKPVPLPTTAPGMVDRVDYVEQVGVLHNLPDGINVYRNDLVPAGQTNGIAAYSADPNFLPAISGGLAQGKWFDQASRTLPVTVLGASAAARLGISEPGVRIWIDGQWYAVIGILKTAGLAQQVDASVFIGDGWAHKKYANAGAVAADGSSTSGDTISAIYVRVAPGEAAIVRDTVARAANPLSSYVQVSKLSDLEGARQTTSDSLAGLAIGLAAIALLVGAIGIANTMVVAVLERRGEIGLRRSLGARSGQIASQFVGEAIVLAGLGGLAGMACGAACVVVYANLRGAPVVIPSEILIGAPLIAVAIGIVAGLYPALSASRLSPTIALRSV